MSKLWVGLFSGSSTNFVSPLIESLKHEMTLNPDNKLNIQKDISLNNSINNALTNEQLIPKNPVFKYFKNKPENTVRSVQRMENSSRKSAPWVASNYPKWLSSKFGKLIEDAEEMALLLKFTFRICLQ